MDDEEVAFRMEAWNESVATGGRPIVVSHWSSEQSPQHEAVCAEEVVSDQVVQEEVITMEEMIHSAAHPDQHYIVGGEILPHSISQSLDQMAAENLIYMAQDVGIISTDMINQHQSNSANNENDLVHCVDDVSNGQTDQQYFECQVTEEVITDEWVETAGQDRVEIVVDQLGTTDQQDDDIDISLPTDQDEYSASRPHPCDFCSRRFRKKANLMNHMIAHQNDRPHCCNLCGARYTDKNELMNHLKIHAYAPTEDEPDDDQDLISNDLNELADDSFFNRELTKHPRKRSVKHQQQQLTSGTHSGVGRRRKQDQAIYEQMDEDMRILTEAAEQHYAHTMSLEPRFPVTDPRKPCVCQHCGVGFAREKALASHARIHGGDSPFECETCGEMFWDAAVLREHTRNKHQIQSSNSEYEPENDESDLSDSDSKFGDYYCNTCGMSFHRVDLLKRHARLHLKKDISDPDDGHMCNVCGETFREALDLLAHAEAHARYQPHRCMLCGESFSNESSLSTHVKNVHADLMTPNSCLLCGKQCRDKKALLKHSWEHSKEREHTCSKCAKTFHNKARLKRHMASHRNKCVSCDICGEQFPDGRSLMNHRHSHSSISGRQFPCRECGKTFGSRSSQQIHIRIHTGERPYGCRFCWKAFADGGTLRKHERIHTGEKPYACAVCPRAFNQRVVLREHIRSHHSGPDTSRGSHSSPYSCAVCSDVFTSSHDLIQHLIHHSDMNTAMKRQPQVGPRKYKRRRKLKPYEVDRLVRKGEHRKDKQRRESEGERESDVWYSDFSPALDDLDRVPISSGSAISGQSASGVNNTMDYGPSTNAPGSMNSPRSLGRKSLSPSKKQKIKNSNATSSNNDDGYQAVCDSFETVMQSFSTLVKDMKANKAKKKKELVQQAHTSRPKMIHTAKTRVDQEGKKKTKTLITRTTASTMVTQTNQSVQQTQALHSYKSERNRPRTKNVNYHVLQSERLQPAVFPDSQLNMLSMENSLKIKSEPCDMMHFESSPPPASNEVDITTSTTSGNLDSPLKDIKGIEKFNSDLVHDLEQILQSPIRPKMNSESSGTNNNEQENGSGRKTKQEVSKKKREIKLDTKNQTITMRRSVRNTAKKSEFRNKRSVVTDFKDVIVKEEIMDPDENEDEVGIFKCEMCSESFMSRSDLLLHVPVHI